MSKEDKKYWAKTVVAFFVMMFVFTEIYQFIRFTSGMTTVILAGLIVISTGVVMIAVRVLELLYRED